MPESLPPSRLSRCRQAVIDSARAWRNSDPDAWQELIAAVDALEVAEREPAPPDLVALLDETTQLAARLADAECDSDAERRIAEIRRVAGLPFKPWISGP